MNRLRIDLGFLLLLAACSGAERGTGASADESLGVSSWALVDEQGQQLQGQQLQGQQLQGQQLQGQQLQGQQLQSPVLEGGSWPSGPIITHRLTGLVLGGTALEAARVEQGGLVAERLIPLVGTTDSLAPCTHTSVGLRRSCGWGAEGVGTCAPGTQVQVGAGACGLGTCSGDAMLRVCTGASPCEHGPVVDAQASQGMLAASDNACGTACPSVTFTCPASGRYTVLSAPHSSMESASAEPAASQASFPGRETLRGAQLAGAELQGESDTGEVMRYRLAAVQTELSRFDPQGGGDTFLYRLEGQGTDGAWQPFCAPDSDGLQVAIPLGAVFDRTGARRESSTHLTFGCTVGALAKCYRWGYKPWLVHPDDPAMMRNVHWACTRMARADYCGDGTSHTRDGTLINLWDTVPPPGPIQTHGEPVPGMLFEAGWNPGGAVCLSKERWATLPPEVAAACPDRLIPPGTSTGGATVCGSPSEALAFDPEVRLFNESQLNAN